MCFVTMFKKGVCGFPVTPGYICTATSCFDKLSTSNYVGLAAQIDTYGNGSTHNLLEHQSLSNHVIRLSFFQFRRQREIERQSCCHAPHLFKLCKKERQTEARERDILMNRPLPAASVCGWQQTSTAVKTCSFLMHVSGFLQISMMTHPKKVV